MLSPGCHIPHKKIHRFCTVSAAVNVRELYYIILFQKKSFSLTLCVHSLCVHFVNVKIKTAYRNVSKKGNCLRQSYIQFHLCDVQMDLCVYVCVICQCVSAGMRTLAHICMYNTHTKYAHYSELQYIYDNLVKIHCAHANRYNILSIFYRFACLTFTRIAYHQKQQQQ